MSEFLPTDSSGGDGTTPATVVPLVKAKAPAAKRDPKKGFNLTRHKRVNRLRTDGIWTYLGERFGGLEVRLRPFYERPVVVAREAAEEAMKMQLGLAEDESLPGDYGMDVNRISVRKAVTGARGEIQTDMPEALALARQHGWQIEPGDSDGDWITFTGTEDQEGLRKFLEMMDDSTHVLLTLVRASRGLHKLKDEVIDPLGVDFVYGQHVAVDWAD